MKPARSNLRTLNNHELQQITGGMFGLSQPSTAKAMMEGYKSLDYKYIGEQFKPVTEQVIAGAVTGFAIGRTPIAVGEGALGGAVYGSTTTLLNQDFNKWIKPEPAKPSWADFRLLDRK